MKATLTKNSHVGAIDKHRKEKNFAVEYAVIVPNEDAGYPAEYNGSTMRTVITARLYVIPSKSFGTSVHACIWINSPVRGERDSYSLSGGGRATGCGYDKFSAALADAIANAGIQFDESIAGRGEGAMRDAMGAIAKELGYERFHLHYAHA